MADNCLFCRKLVHKRSMCEEHYKEYTQQKIIQVKTNRREVDFKQYYHNLRHSVYKFIEFPTIVSLCIKMIALADIFFEHYHNGALVDVVLTDVNKIVRHKVKQIKENRHIMMERYTTLFNDIDFRSKWNANIRTEDGHYVRSRAEQLIDNFLYHHNIVHAYEKLIILERENEATLLCDFYIPETNTYIEYYGKYDAEYIARKNAKDLIYRENNIDYIALGKKHLDNLDDTLLKEIITRRSHNKKGQL